MNKLKNMTTEEEAKRLYHDEELPQTFSKPEQPKKKIIRKEIERPKLKHKETMAKEEKIELSDRLSDWIYNYKLSLTYERNITELLRFTRKGEQEDNKKRVFSQFVRKSAFKLSSAYESSLYSIHHRGIRKNCSPLPNLSRE